MMASAFGRDIRLATIPPGELTLPERLNFLLTNRIPRRLSTRFMGWFSRLESPFLAKLSIAVWQFFADDLRLHEARRTRFASLHDCFIRELKPGARPVNRDPGVLTSPCDAVVGEFGDVSDFEVIQAKGFPYSLRELVCDDDIAERYRNGRFVTLRLKSSMYHRFHAPMKGRVGEVRYISGDTWNVNPVALKLVERLFCRNERAVLELVGEHPGYRVLLVPVAAILVASMRIHGLPVPLNLQYAGPNRLPLDRCYDKGEEMGFFEHGSTIVVLTTTDFRFVDGLVTGTVIRMGERLMARDSSLTR
jgi:phosphatidylserine decarboxylase